MDKPQAAFWLEVFEIDLFHKKHLSYESCIFLDNGLDLSLSQYLIQSMYLSSIIILKIKEAVILNPALQSNKTMHMISLKKKLSLYCFMC